LDSVLFLSRVQLETSSVSSVLPMVLRNVILVPGFLSILQLLPGLASLALLTVAFLVSSATKCMPCTVPIQSQLMSLFYTESLWVPSFTSTQCEPPFSSLFLVFLSLISFSLLRHYVSSLDSHIYVKFYFLCSRSISIPHFSISSSRFQIC